MMIALNQRHASLHIAKILAQQHTVVVGQDAKYLIIKLNVIVRLDYKETHWWLVFPLVVSATMIVKTMKCVI